MKLLELAEKIVDPWDLAFVSVSYVVGFVVGTILTPGGISAGELGGLFATGGLSAKQILWRVSARRRVRRRAGRFRALLAASSIHDALLTRLDREIALLSNSVVGSEQATRYIDTLIEEFRVTKPSATALPASLSTSSVTQYTLPPGMDSTVQVPTPTHLDTLPPDTNHNSLLQKGTTLRLEPDQLRPGDLGAPSPLDVLKPSSD